MKLYKLKHRHRFHNIHIQILCVLMIGSILLSSSGCNSSHEKKKTNVLFIAVDDLRPELGCYGNPHIKTPNLDRLAKSGVLFNRAYCQVAVCNPSRASLMTGMRPDSLKVWDLRVHFRDTHPEVVTLPQHFKQNGYHVEGIGKLYHHIFGAMEDPQSWSVPKLKTKGTDRLYPEKDQKALEKFKEAQRQLGKSEFTVNRFRGPATVCEDVKDNQRYDGAITDVAVEQLGKLKDRQKPFFLAVGYFQPHLPFSAPKKYWDMYDPEKIPSADNRYLPKGAPPWAMNTMYELRVYMDFVDTPAPQDEALTEQQQRHLKHGYYASVSYVDAQLGRLLDELDRLGLSDETIIVLWGDHGWKLGEHRSWCKQTTYEIDARVPMMVAAPGCGGKGTVSDSLVEFIDIYPTLCDLAGLPQPDQLDGKSMKPILNDPQKAIKDGAFSQYWRQKDGQLLMGHSLRTKRYRYIEWASMKTSEIVATELYDHQDDPQENMNIAADANNASLIQQLQTQLRKTCPVVNADSLAVGKHSGKAGKACEFVVENKLTESVAGYWIDPTGVRKLMFDLKPSQKKTVQSFYNSVFALVSQSGNYYEWIKTDDIQGSVVVAK